MQYADTLGVALVRHPGSSGPVTVMSMPLREAQSYLCRYVSRVRGAGADRGNIGRWWHCVPHSTVPLLSFSHSTWLSAPDSLPEGVEVPRCRSSPSFCGVLCLRTENPEVGKEQGPQTQPDGAHCLDFSPTNRETGLTLQNSSARIFAGQRW